MLPQQQKSFEDFANEFKGNFDGSPDYNSGVNDALWTMLNFLITDNGQFYESLRQMRYDYLAAPNEIKITPIN